MREQRNSGPVFESDSGHPAKIWSLEQKYTIGNSTMRDRRENLKIPKSILNWRMARKAEK